MAGAEGLEPPADGFGDQNFTFHHLSTSIPWFFGMGYSAI